MLAVPSLVCQGNAATRQKSKPLQRITNLLTGQQWIKSGHDEKREARRACRMSGARPPSPAMVESDALTALRQALRAAYRMDETACVRERRVEAGA